MRGLTPWPWGSEDPLGIKGPSAGPSAHTAHQHLLHKGCHPVPPAGPLPWVRPAAGPLPACRLPLDIPAGGPDLVWRQKEEGDSAGRKKEGLLQALFFCPFWFAVFFPPSLSLPLCLHFWQYDRPLAQGGENCKVSHSHHLHRDPEQPWLLAVLSSSAPLKETEA